MRTRSRFIAVGALGAMLVAGATFSTGPRRAGDEVDTGLGWYGWVTSYDVGHVFADGLAMVEITRSAEGPLRLISVTPITEGADNLRVLGVRARLLGCGLSGEDRHAFDVLDGFPPEDPMAAGSAPLEGFEVPARERTPAGERCGSFPNRLYLNLLFGYEVVGEGKSWRKGSTLLYEYQGHVREVYIQNRMTVCVPAEVECEFVEPDDE